MQQTKHALILRTAISFILCIALSIFSNVTYSANDPQKTEQELKLVQEKIAALKERLNKTKKQHSKVNQELKKAEQQINTAAKVCMEESKQPALPVEFHIRPIQFSKVSQFQYLRCTVPGIDTKPICRPVDKPL